MQILNPTFIKGVRGTDRILTDGIAQVAFVGRSNVGKSSTLQAILKEKDLVKTGKKPGKTTEINFFKAQVSGKNCYFVDLPGYGYAHMHPDEREKLRKLILWYLQFAEVKPLAVVVVLDSKVGLTAFDSDMLDVLKLAGHRAIILANKIDKLNQKERAAALAGINAEIKEGKFDATVIAASAETKEGIDTLLQTIFN